MTPDAVIARLDAVQLGRALRAGGLLLSSGGWFAPFRNQKLGHPELLAGRTPRTVNMKSVPEPVKSSGSGKSSSTFSWARTPTPAATSPTSGT